MNDYIIKLLLDNYKKQIADLQETNDRLTKRNLELKNELLEKDLELMKGKFAFEKTIIHIAEGKDFLNTDYIYTFKDLIAKHGYYEVLAKLTELANEHTPDSSNENDSLDDDLPFAIE